MKRRGKEREKSIAKEQSIQQNASVPRTLKSPAPEEPGTHLGEGVALLPSVELGLEVGVDGVGGSVLGSSDGEGDARRSLGLDLERGGTEGVVSGKEVVGRLADVLQSERKKGSQEKAGFDGEETKEGHGGGWKRGDRATHSPGDRNESHC